MPTSSSSPSKTGSFALGSVLRRSRLALIFAVLGGAALVALIPACSTDIDLNADFEETPVLFGLLDPSVDTHFIRINRAFLKDGASALVLAQDSEEIYYGEELSARLERYDNGVFAGSFPLIRVDGDSLGRSKDPGIFAENPNILYRHVGQLNPESTYRVVAEAPDLGISINAETGLIEDFPITRPNPNPTPSSSLSFAGTGDFLVRWANGPGAKTYQLDMLFFLREVDRNDLDNTLGDTVLYWRLFNNELVSNPDGSEGKEFFIDRDGFYNFLVRSVEPDPGVFRFIDSVQFRFYAGNQDLYNYILFSSTQLGITADQVSALYTNVDGGLGLLGSRYERFTPKYKLSNQTLDSIACGSISGGLDFAASGDSPFFPLCP